MESLLNQEIREKLEEIISIIKNSKQYQEYLYLEKKMKNHSRIPKQIEKIKQLQKKIVKLEMEWKTVTFIEKQLSILEQQLKEIPLYQDFIDIQRQLNDNFQWIKQSIEELFKF